MSQRRNAESVVAFYVAIHSAAAVVIGVTSVESPLSNVLYKRTACNGDKSAEWCKCTEQRFMMTHSEALLGIAGDSTALNL